MSFISHPLPSHIDISAISIDLSGCKYLLNHQACPSFQSVVFVLGVLLKKELSYIIFFLFLLVPPYYCYQLVLFYFLIISSIVWSSSLIIEKLIPLSLVLNNSIKFVLRFESLISCSFVISIIVLLFLFPTKIHLFLN